MPRGLIVGTAAAVGLAWTVFGLAVHARSGLTSPLVQTGLYSANLVVTARSRRLKVLVVRTLQRWVVNPLVRGLFAAGVNPLGLVILETRGRVSGKPRRTPVGNGRQGKLCYVIAEHGLRAGWVRNVLADPRVRVRLRVGLRHRWASGTAQVLYDDDPLARQRSIARWHPLRAFNAMNVRVLGADLVTVRIDLDAEPSRPDAAVRVPAAT